MKGLEKTTAKGKTIYFVSNVGLQGADAVANTERAWEEIIGQGLEFDVVFIVGCEDGLLPLRWGDADDEALAEERRLFFVGMTRARKRLFLSWARRRQVAGRVKTARSRRFSLTCRVKGSSAARPEPAARRETGR